MICEKVRGRLDDFVDGVLSAGDADDVRRHLDSCDACRGEERGLRDVIARAAALRGESEPARDLWSGIRERIEQRAVEAHYRTASGRAWTRLAGAAAVVVVVVATAVVAYRWGRESVSPGVVPVGQRASAGGVEAEFTQAKTQLLALLDERKASLPPTALERIESNLKTIDDSVVEIRSALEQDPGNPDLNRLLIATYKRQVELLQRVYNWSARM